MLYNVLMAGMSFKFLLLLHAKYSMSIFFFKWTGKSVYLGLLVGLEYLYKKQVFLVARAKGKAAFQIFPDIPSSPWAAFFSRPKFRVDLKTTAGHVHTTPSLDIWIKTKCYISTTSYQS